MLRLVEQNRLQSTRDKEALWEIVSRKVRIYIQMSVQGKGNPHGLSLKIVWVADSKESCLRSEGTVWGSTSAHS